MGPIFHKDFLFTEATDYVVEGIKPIIPTQITSRRPFR